MVLRGFKSVAVMQICSVCVNCVCALWCVSVHWLEGLFSLSTYDPSVKKLHVPTCRSERGEEWQRSVMRGWCWSLRGPKRMPPWSVTSFWFENLTIVKRSIVLHEVASRNRVFELNQYFLTLLQSVWMCDVSMWQQLVTLAKQVFTNDVCLGNAELW